MAAVRLRSARAEVRGTIVTESPHNIIIVDPQHEKLAASHLTGRGIACYLPLEPAYRTRGARRRPMKIQVPIFRGYLFVPVSESYVPSCGSGGAREYDLRLPDGTVGRIAFKNRGFAADAMWGIHGLMMWNVPDPVASELEGHPIFKTEPAVLSARSMSAVREIERRQNTPGPLFLQDDLIRILRGLLEGEMLPVFACEDENVILLVEMMGRKVRMRRDIFDVELVLRAQ